MKPIWHNISEKPDKNLKLLIVENLAYDCCSRTIRGYYDGKNFVFKSKNGEKFVIKDVLEWAYDVDY